MYVYLSVERNVAHTARLVHMHRNGVLYRIEKIKDTLGLDLESSEVRLRLMISFKIMEYLGKVNLDVLPAPEDENQIFQIEWLPVHVLDNKPKMQRFLWKFL